MLSIIFYRVFFVIGISASLNLEIYLNSIWSGFAFSGERRLYKASYDLGKEKELANIKKCN